MDVKVKEAKSVNLGDSFHIVGFDCTKILVGPEFVEILTGDRVTDRYDVRKLKEAEFTGK